MALDGSDTLMGRRKNGSSCHKDVRTWWLHPAFPGHGRTCGEPATTGGMAQSDTFTVVLLLDVTARFAHSFPSLRAGVLDPVLQVSQCYSSTRLLAKGTEDHRGHTSW